MKKLIAIALTTLTLLVGTQTSSLSAAKKTAKKPVTISKTVTPKPTINEVKPMTAEYWEIFQGFDFSGKLKQVYTGNNIAYENKTILLEAFKETTPNPLYTTGIDDERVYTKTAEYSGGKLILKEKFLYGKISFQAKFPNSPGTMPALWLFDEVKSGPNQHYTEIDLIEIPGSEKGNMYSGAHWGLTYQDLKKDFSKRFVPNVANQFHKYEVIKTPNYISVYVDGKLLKYFTVADKKLLNGVNGFRQPLQLVINMNVGDNWGGVIDDDAFPHKFVIKDLVIQNQIFK